MQDGSEWVTFNEQQDSCTELLPGLLGEEHAKHVACIRESRAKESVELQRKYLLLDAVLVYSCASELGINLHDVIREAYIKLIIERANKKG